VTTPGASTKFPQLLGPAPTRRQKIGCAMRSTRSTASCAFGCSIEQAIHRTRRNTKRDVNPPLASSSCLFVPSWIGTRGHCMATIFVALLGAAALAPAARAGDRANFDDRPCTRSVRGPRRGLCCRRRGRRLAHHRRGKTGSASDRVRGLPRSLHFLNPNRLGRAARSCPRAGSTGVLLFTRRGVSSGSKSTSTPYPA